MNWRKSLFCCCITSMEQAVDGAETAAIDRLVLSWSEKISVWFCLRAPGYGFTLWCACGLLVGGTLQVSLLQCFLLRGKINLIRAMISGAMNVTVNQGIYLWYYVCTHLTKEQLIVSSVIWRQSKTLILSRMPYYTTSLHTLLRHCGIKWQTYSVYQKLLILQQNC